MFRFTSGHDTDSGNLFYIRIPLHGQESDAVAFDTTAAHLDLAVALAVIGLEGKNFVRFMSGALEHGSHPLFRREDDGQAVGIFTYGCILQGRNDLALREEFLGILQGTLKDNTLTEL